MPIRGRDKYNPPKPKVTKKPRPYVAKQAAPTKPFSVPRFKPPAGSERNLTDLFLQYALPYKALEGVANSSYYLNQLAPKVGQALKGSFELQGEAALATARGRQEAATGMVSELPTRLRELYRGQRILPQRWLPQGSYELSRGWQREKATEGKYNMPPVVKPTTTTTSKKSGIRGLHSRYNIGYHNENVQRQQGVLGDFALPEIPMTSPTGYYGGYGGYGGGGGGGGGSSEYNYPGSPFAQYQSGYPIRSVASAQSPVVRTAGLPQQRFAANPTLYPARWNQLAVNWRI
jgi:hypothetical protein